MDILSTLSVHLLNIAKSQNVNCTKMQEKKADEDLFPSAFLYAILAWTFPRFAIYYPVSLHLPAPSRFAPIARAHSSVALIPAIIADFTNGMIFRFKLPFFHALLV